MKIKFVGKWYNTGVLLFILVGRKGKRRRRRRRRRKRKGNETETQEDSLCCSKNNGAAQINLQPLQIDLEYS